MRDERNLQYSIDGGKKLSKIDDIRGFINAEHLDAVLLSDEMEVSWATGFTGDDSHCLITKDEAVFYTDFRYLEQAHFQISGFEIVETGYAERLKRISHSIGKTVGIDFKRTSLSEKAEFESVFCGAVFRDISPFLDELRMIKSQDEIMRQKEGAKITQDAFHHVLKLIKLGMSENDINAELIYFFNKNGAEPSFKPIVASGENGSMPHATVSNRRIKNGDLITMDFGVKYKGICTDFTRTIAVGGIEKDKQIVYNTVNNAHKAALSALKPGTTGKDVDAAARDVIDNAGYRGRFGHGTGHGVGLEIHEAPRLSVASSDVLRPGMVVTVEPGIYIPKEFGVRIEDMLLITKDGYENFYTAEKEIIII